MLDLHSTVTIHYPIETVFPFFTDLRNELSWHPDMLSMLKTSEGPVGQRSKFLGKYKQIGEMDILITRYEPNRRADFHCISKAFTLDMQCQLRPASDGTELDVAMQMELHGFMRLLQPMIRSKMLKDWSKKAVQIEAGIAKMHAGSKAATAGVGVAA